jgi:predicted nucleic-acid-binding Zn-ribbon protein
MPLTICKSAAWYLVITCKRCGVRQPIGRDPSMGKAELLRTYKWQCVDCGYEGKYQPEEVERYQHPV